MASPLEGTASARAEIARVHFTHDAMIDLILREPQISQGAIAKHFGYSQAWVSRIFNSDAFNARLAERKSELVDPSILHTMEERFKAMAAQSLDIVMEKLAATRSPDLALKSLELSSRALGYGARAANVAVQQNFVVAMPQKAPSAEAWAEKYQGQLGAGTGSLNASPGLVQMVEAVEVVEAK